MGRPAPSRCPALAARLLAGALAGALLLAACGDGHDVEGEVVVGVGSTVEQQVLAALTVVALEQAGYAPAVVTGLGDTVSLRRRARSGAIDLYWDYTGAAWALGLGQENPPADPRESYERVREQDLQNGLTWLDPTDANATLAFFVRPEALPPEPPSGMGWLAGTLSAESETLCVDDDFRRRPGGLRQLATEHYPMSLERVSIVSADEERAVGHVASGRCFAGLATATSGSAHREGLVRVEDELRVFPAFVVAPVVRAGLLEEEPGVADALAPVVERLDTAALSELNAAAADTDPRELARAFLAGDEDP